MGSDVYRNSIHPKAALAAQRCRRNKFALWALITLSVGVLGTSLVVSCHPVPAKSITVQLPSSSDYCLAQTVVENAPSAGWIEQALIVQTSLNDQALKLVDGLPEASCSYNGAEHTHTYLQALSVVQAVKAGDYQIAPAFCAGATSFHREDEAAELLALYPTLPCVAGGFVFVLPSDQSGANR